VKVTQPEREAIAALDRFAEARRAIKVQQASYSIGDLWALWMDDRQKDGLSNAVYAANWVALKAAFANRAPHLLTTDDCREYAKARFALGRAPATVNTELMRLRHCLKWAHDNNLIAKACKVWVPPAGKSRDRVLTPDEAFKLIQAAAEGDPHIGLFVALVFSTGGRHTAILDLTWDRVDFTAGTIELDENIPPDPMNKSWRKGRAKVWMSNLARKALVRAYAGRQKSGYVIEHGGRRLKTVREGFRNAVERAGLGTYVLDSDGERAFQTDITPHTIRHTAATWTYGKVETALTAQMLGHRDERTTRMVYQHPDASKTRPAVEVIDAAFAALPELADSRPVQGSKRVKKRKLMSTIDDNRR
jgi:integrase